MPGRLKVDLLFGMAAAETSIARWNDKLKPQVAGASRASLTTLTNREDGSAMSRRLQTAVWRRYVCDGVDDNRRTRLFLEVALVNSRHEVCTLREAGCWSVRATFKSHEMEATLPCEVDSS
jgi:hypothetical protein